MPENILKWRPGSRSRDADCIYNYEKGLAMRKLDPHANVTELFRTIVRNGGRLV